MIREGTASGAATGETSNSSRADSKFLDEGRNACHLDTNNTENTAHSTGRGRCRRRWPHREALLAWRMRALIVAAVFGLLSFVCFAGRTRAATIIMRAYLMGYMTCFNFAGGALVLLMLQYVSGGKWGLLLRRPLEAMTRTLPLVALIFIPIGALHASICTSGRCIPRRPLRQRAGERLDHAGAGADGELQAADAEPVCADCGVLRRSSRSCSRSCILLNRWSLERDADPERGTEPQLRPLADEVREPERAGHSDLRHRADGGRDRVDQVAGCDLVLVDLGPAVPGGAGLWRCWRSSILSVILLSRYEPMKTLLRTTEQHDLGKFLFAFVMLNIYLTFAEFLIIWSGNIPDEIPWYLNRIHGGWWTICTLDFICHWLIPFCLLLSRDLKRNKQKMIWITCFMIFARLRGYVLAD